MSGEWGWNELCECCTGTGTGTGTGTDYGTGTDPRAVTSPCSGQIVPPYYLQSASNTGGTATDSNDDALEAILLSGPGSISLTQSPVVGRPPSGWNLEIDGATEATFFFLGFETPIKAESECRPLYQAYLCGEFLINNTASLVIRPAFYQDGTVYAGTFFGAATSASGAMTAWAGKYEGYTRTGFDEVTGYTSGSPYFTFGTAGPNFNPVAPDLKIGWVVRATSASGFIDIHLDNWVARRDMACCGGITEYPVEYTLTLAESQYADPGSPDNVTTDCPLSAVDFTKTFITDARVYIAAWLNASYVIPMFWHNTLRYHCRGTYTESHTYFSTGYATSFTIDLIIVIEIRDCTYDSGAGNPLGTIGVGVTVRLHDNSANDIVFGCAAGTLRASKNYSDTPTCSTAEDSCCADGDLPMTSEMVLGDFQFSPPLDWTGTTINLARPA